MSLNILRELGWSDIEGPFECWGLFRRRGELLCSPVNQSSEDGAHPFARALEYLDIAPPDRTVSLEDIPPAKVITAADRLIKFEAAWVGKKGQQLDLKIGARAAEKLGWVSNHKSVVHVASWGRVLLVLSDERFGAIEDEDFTGGYLQGL